jgi:hypothetical protein
LYICSYAFAICAVIEALSHITFDDSVILSTQDIYLYMIRTVTRAFVNICLVDRVLTWVVLNGCVGEDTFPFG